MPLSARGLDYLDGTAAVLCLAGFVASLVRRLHGEPVSWVLIVLLPFIALLAVLRIAKRKKPSSPPKNE